MTDATLPPASERGSGGRARLALLLRGARERAGVSGAEAGRRCGLAQSKISRIETGALLPTLGEIEVLAKSYGAPADVRIQLRDLTRTLREEQANRVVLTRGIAASRSRFRELESTARVIRGYQCQMVVGLLQTDAYQRAVFGEPDLVADAHGESGNGDATAEVAAARADQTERRSTVLDDPAKSFVFVMTEGALRWQVKSPTLMKEQLEHLSAAAAARPNIRVGIIPWTTPMRFFPAGSFWLYDSEAALVGMEIGNLVPTGRADVAAYIDRFAALEQAAVFGEDARAQIDRIAADYRGLPATSQV